MILTQEEKSSLRHSLVELGLRGQLYLSKHDSPGAKPNSKKLFSHFKTKLPPHIETSWLKDRLSSWSHTSHWVGLWVSHSGQTVGLDLEETKRIKANLLMRIANPNDLVLPSHQQSQYLWNIKEASFKALSLHTPIKTISEVSVIGLRPIKSLLNQCFAKAQSPDKLFNLTALCFQKNNLNFCIAQASSFRLNP